MVERQSSPTPTLLHGWLVLVPMVLGTPRCTFKAVAANAPLTPPGAQHCPVASSPGIVQPCAHHLCMQPWGSRGSQQGQEQERSWWHRVPGAGPGLVAPGPRWPPRLGAAGAASAEQQPRRCLGGSRRSQKRPGRSSSGSTNRL